MQYDDVAVEALVQQITAYLRDNPMACDTQEGIARWWLAPGTGVDDQVLSRALQWMQQQRLIESLSATAGRVRFRRIAVPTDRGGSVRMN